MRRKFWSRLERLWRLSDNQSTHEYVAEKDIILEDDLVHEGMQLTKLCGRTTFNIIGTMAVLQISILHQDS
jgi:hypothetical protein